MADLDELYARVKGLLAAADVTFREFEHEPVLDYEAAARVREQHGMRGRESKSIFIKTKDARFFMFVSLEGVRLDSKVVKEMVGSRVSFCSNEELRAITGCEPGCATPFGHAPQIGLIVDSQALGADYFLFSPGHPTRTIEIAGADISRVLQHCPNQQFSYTALG